MFDNYHCITAERFAKFRSLRETGTLAASLAAKLGAAPVKSSDSVRSQLDGGWHQSVLVIVRVPACPEIAGEPNARVPEERVNHEIAANGQSSPEPHPVSRIATGRVEPGNEMRAGGSEGIRDFNPPRTVAKIHSGQKDKDSGNNPQNDGPKRS